jgi:hypothetical protein
MSPLEPLAPDQRAVVALVLQQGRSYEEIASLLGMPVEAVRARAHAGMDTLAGDNGLPAEITGPLADYLLGQQPERDAGATRGLLAESAAARAWAADVVAQLEDVAPRGLPGIPGGEETAAPTAGRSSRTDDESAAPAAGRTSRADDEATAPAAGRSSRTDDEATAPAAGRSSRTDDEAGARIAGRGSPRRGDAAAPGAPGPRPRPVREEDRGGESPPAASRLGGILLIAGVVAVIAVVLFLVLSGGGDDPGDEQAASPAPAASATPSATATPQVADAIPLRSTTGGKAKGAMTVYLQDGQLLFALEAQDVPPSRQGAAYAVWFVGPGDKARRLGFTNPVGDDGQLGIQGPSQKDLEEFPKLYATRERVVVSQETTEDAKRPSRVILSGKLPKGR